jgi:hypothetical protein
MGNLISNLRQGGQAFRPGQILQGKIMALYPNNKAQIQLGTTLLIAQLEASLEIGARYHFQVQEGQGIPRLRVVGEALRQSQLHNAESLLQQIGIKPSKGNVEFVEQLLQQKIPIEKGQLQQAMPLLDRADNRVIAQRVLVEMLVNRIPITNTTFQALLSKVSNGFTSQLQFLEQTLQQDQGIEPQLKQQLVTQLGQLTGNSTDSKLNLIRHLTDNPATFNFLKAIRVVNRDMQYTGWSEQIKQSNQPEINGSTNQINPVRLLQVLAETLPKVETIRQQAVSFLQTWGNILHESVAKGSALPEEQYTRLTQDLKQNMPAVTQQTNFQVHNNPQDLRNMIIDLEILANHENQSKIDAFQTKLMKDLFLEQTKNLLTQSGINYEKVILQDEQNPQHTLKGLVTHLMQTSEGNTQEQATRLLHYMNGVQLQSVQESGNFLQAQLVIPGGKFGLNSDMELTLEGTKNDDGELNKDFCRIMFFLDLNNIQKTIIDMHVQKRTISLTILNDFPIENVMNSLRTALREGLAKMDYQLTSVSHKPLTTNQPVEKKPKMLEKQQATYQGVDYRI